MQATTLDVHAALPAMRGVLDRLQAELDWDIGVAYHTPAVCYHGGAFFQAVGEEFDCLERLKEVISADVLDAWFPPAPSVVQAVAEHLPELLRSSPPTAAGGLARAIGRARGVPPECILPGAGSSDLIFLALRSWLSHRSRVLILDPMYSEYSHLLEKVVRCPVDRLLLKPEENYALDVARLEARLDDAYDLIVLVNPNSPTGQHVPRAKLEQFLKRVPPATRVWVDETYVDYAGLGESVEAFAAGSLNVMVCKSMSKAYALSGARAAYLCGGRHLLEALRPLSPPWSVSLPAQVAAVRALQDPEYYTARYHETHHLRQGLMAGLQALGWHVTPSVTNFLLCRLPATGPDTATLLERCRARDLFLRDPSNMGTRLGDRAVRIAVKDAATNERMLGILREIGGSAS
jgi:histidinol-phosphate/aromatic aminotransferase/cobyric acid decarboxylase-like protein